MKKIGMLISAAFLGSVFTTGTWWFLDTKKERSITIQHVNEPLGQNAGYKLGSMGNTSLDFREVSKKVMPAVVHIRSTQTAAKSVSSSQRPGLYHDPFKRFFQDDLFEDFFGPRFRFESPKQQRRSPQVQVGTGSGVIINEKGYIVTNNHVISNADDIEVTLYDNRTYKATVVGSDPTTDLALIQIKEKNLPTIPLTNSDAVEVGEWVLAVGNPFNLNSTVTAGIVSAKARSINILKEESAIESFIQTDAAINPGNSGGALVNLEGGLIGINTAIASPTGAYAGYGFAVPANIVNKVVEDLLQYGIVQRGFLGVIIKEVNGNLAKEHDLEVTEGVFVDSLMEDGAAKSAGVKKGDVITKVDGAKIKSVPKLQELIGRHRPGDKVQLEINREGKEKEITIVLRNKDGQSELVAKEHKELLTILGADLEEINKKTAKRLDIKGGVKVKKLFAGKLKRYTDIREGFIITKISGKEVSSVDDLVAALTDKKGGIMVEGVYEDYPGDFFYAFGL